MVHAPNTISRMIEIMELDRIDIELLRLLRNNARMPNKDLAEKVGVAPSTALERIRRMREAKIIEGYHAELSPTGIGIVLRSAPVAAALSGSAGVTSRTNGAFVTHFFTTVPRSAAVAAWPSASCCFQASGLPP